MITPNTEREALEQVMRQCESDLKSAHAEICKLQNLDPAKHDWPEWRHRRQTRFDGLEKSDPSLALHD